MFFIIIIIKELNRVLWADIDIHREERGLCIVIEREKTEPGESLNGHCYMGHLMPSQPHGRYQVQILMVVVKSYSVVIGD